MAAGGALGAYIWHRGIRYPRLSLEPKPLSYSHKTSKGSFIFRDLIALENEISKGNFYSDAQEFRAFAPEPKLTIEPSGEPFTIRINNVSVHAKLRIEGKAKVDEQIEGITRVLDIKSTKETFKLHWQLPSNQTWQFAIIGDTGANAELDACIDRAYELGAHFLLHLGDFNYIDGEYARAVHAFQHAPLPCFVSIGNHDFHDNGLIYDLFREQIGPMNNAFTINGVRMVNLDTAADFLPAQSGNRGNLLRSLSKNPQTQIIFTHRPLKDPRPHDDHEVTGLNEASWLAQALNAAGGGYYLNGHVHHSAEFEHQGIRQYTIGEGLGHEDLVLQKQVAKLLMASITPESKINFKWQPINIPWSAHLSATHSRKLKDDGRQKQLDWYQNLLQQTV